MSDQITTFTKIHFNPLKPEADGISVKDIAHALSMMVRANGHFPEFYSVGQHSVHCAGEALERGLDERTALACLLHDASEAYLSDITRPVKQYLAEYREAEKVLQEIIYEKYLGSPLSGKERSLVREIDNTLFYYEFLHYMGEKKQEEPPAIRRIPVFETVSFKEAEREFLELFGKLNTQGQGRDKREIRGEELC